jgi:hypothetical protein
MYIKWNQYTWYSKLAAAIFFIIILPAWTFYLGTEYEKTVEVIRASDELVRQNAQIQYKKHSDFDGKNTSFILEGQKVTLVNGVSQISVDSTSASKVVTRYFGNETKGDLNGDGKDDIAFLVTQTTGGSGIFYYAVVALKTSTGYTTTNAFFIGDRIAPQSTVIPINSRELQVNYAERKLGEPMTAEPTQGAVTLLKVTKEGVLEGLMK